MIISASKRTDVPAFHSSWFMDCLRHNEFNIINPYNKQSKKVYVSPAEVDCIVFWTKDARNIMSSIPELQQMGYTFYFQYTINCYPEKFEPGMKDTWMERVNNFKELSDMIGKDRVILRYDPIFMSDYTIFPGEWNEHTENIDIMWHIQRFGSLLHELKNYTKKCIISFVDVYDKLKDRFAKLNIRPPAEEEIHRMMIYFEGISIESGIQMQTCGEAIDLTKYDITKASCIDLNLIKRLTLRDLKVKSAGQRNNCGCAYAVDIGEYNTCKHGCVYCYANK